MDSINRSEVTLVDSVGKEHRVIVIHTVRSALVNQPGSSTTSAGEGVEPLRERGVYLLRN